MLAALIHVSALASGSVAGLAAGRAMARTEQERLKTRVLILALVGTPLFFTHLFFEVGRWVGVLAYALLFSWIALLDAWGKGLRQRIDLVALTVVVSSALFLETGGVLLAMRKLRDAKPPPMDREVVLQSTGFSCGPASAATCLRRLGLETTEVQVAQISGTTLCGTSMAGLSRAANELLVGTGWRCGKETRSWETLPRDGTPAVLDTRLCGIGHAIAFLGFEGDRAVIGCPSLGRRLLTRGELEEIWRGGGVFLQTEESEGK